MLFVLERENGLKLVPRWERVRTVSQLSSKVNMVAELITTETEPKAVLF
jgi:hypothetical protein